MSHSVYSFWSLLADYAVRVPIIQRDYAQGRLDDRATVIRHKFLHSLHQTLTANPGSKPLDLDFVYGEVLQPQAHFVPLDGQQRLTTLYLLHWYLAAAENRLVEAGPRLARFSYEVRSSSREFCKSLARCQASDFDLTLPASLSTQLRNTVWFQPAWQRDPTVRAMLTMLDAIAEKFGQPTDLFDQLTAANPPLIGFQFLELAKVGLTDDLYLKMNARGKTLTNFENWKAEFDQFLQQQHPNRQAEFAQKVDGRWTDFFWQHQQEGNTALDLAFKRFLDYLTYSLGMVRAGVLPQSATSASAEAPDPFELYRQVYTPAENIDFLFRALDVLSVTAADGLPAFFEAVFTKSGEPGKVALFEGSVDLFARVTGSANSDIRTRVLLFALLYYGVTNSLPRLDGNDVNLRDILRVVRNLLERVRQQKDLRFGYILREENMPNYLADAVTLVAQATSEPDGDVYEALSAILAADIKVRPRMTTLGWAHELFKARLLSRQPQLKPALHQLEDLPVFRGLLHNIKLSAHTEDLLELAAAAEAIWASPLPQALIIGAWLTRGDYSRYNGYSGLGDKYFFGSSDSWYTLLTNNEHNDKIKETLPAFLLAYVAAPGATALEKLTAIREEWLACGPEQDWRYYFIKYPQMMEESTGQVTWQSDYEIRLLSGPSLESRHINPYVRAVIRLVNETFLSSAEYYSTTNDAYESPLYYMGVPGDGGTKHSAWLHCGQKGWYFDAPEHWAPAVSLVKNYRLRSGNATGYWLPNHPVMDRIELAVAFTRDLYRCELVPRPSPD